MYLPLKSLGIIEVELAIDVTKPWSTALAVARTADDHKAINLKILQVKNHCSYADFFVIMSASSKRHAQALADSLMNKTNGSLHGLEGYNNGDWILVDFGDVVIHIFQEAARIYYHFDKLWKHVPDVPFNLRKSGRKVARQHSSIA